MLLEPLNRALIGLVFNDQLAGILNQLFGRAVMYSAAQVHANPIASGLDPNAILYPQYAVGKKIISRAELEELETSYLRQSDISAGMYLPLIGLGVSWHLRQGCCVPSQASAMNALLGLTSFGALFAFAAMADSSEGSQESRSKRKRAGEKFQLLILVALLLLPFLIFWLVSVQSTWHWFAVLPTLLLVAGIERFHRFRSGVQQLVLGRLVAAKEDEAKAQEQTLTLKDALAKAVKEQVKASVDLLTAAQKEAVARSEAAMALDIDQNKAVLSRLEEILKKIEKPQ